LGRRDLNSSFSAAAPPEFGDAAEAGAIEAIHPLLDGPRIFARAALTTSAARSTQLSGETIQALNEIVRTCRYLRHAIGREPTPEEVAGRLRMPPETIRKALGAPCTLT
jgi:hypothetical protein